MRTIQITEIANGLLLTVNQPPAVPSIIFFPTWNDVLDALKQQSVQPIAPVGGTTVVSGFVKR